MINDDFKIVKEEKKEYPPLPKNVYQVELLEINLNDAKGKYAKPGEKNFAFQFTLLAGKNKEVDLRGRNVWNNFVPTSLYVGKNGKNSLWQIIEAFLGRDLTQAEEAEGLNSKMLNNFIGKQIKIFVDHKLSGDKIYNNITSYMPAENQLEPLTAEERDNATVKNKKEEPRNNTESEYDDEIPLPADIPF
jgi:hypothetical protein